MRNDNLRLAIYGVFAAVGAILVFYGAISQDALPLWLQLVDQVGTTLALVLASRNVKNHNNKDTTDAEHRLGG